MWTDFAAPLVSWSTTHLCHDPVRWWLETKGFFMVSRSIKKVLKIFGLAIGCAIGVFVLLCMVVVGCLSYKMRTIDRVYVSYGEMMKEPRAKHLRRWLPPTVTNIHFASNARWGEHTDRFSCPVAESEFVSFVKTNSYVVATNSFVPLDHGGSEAEGPAFRHWLNEMKEHDAETQSRLVFGDAPVPRRFFSLTESHAFDGGSTGGRWRYIIVFDRDACMLTGYVFVNHL